MSFDSGEAKAFPEVVEKWKPLFSLTVGAIEVLLLLLKSPWRSGIVLSTRLHALASSSEMSLRPFNSFQAQQLGR